MCVYLVHGAWCVFFVYVCMCLFVCVCVSVHMWVCVCVCECGVWCVFCMGGCGCVCIDLLAVHKKTQHAGTARCIFEKCTVKNCFVANNTLCQSSDLLNRFSFLQSQKMVQQIRGLA
jgi:hypothetical protein